MKLLYENLWFAEYYSFFNLEKENLGTRNFITEDYEL